MKNNKFKYICISLLIVSISIFTYKYIIPRYKNSSNIRTSFQEFLYEYEDFSDELPVPISKKCKNKQKQTIAISKAKEDMEYLFSILKYGYSAYNFFGGDEAFLQAKDNIILSIEKLDKENICKDNLLQIIISNLDFIQDSHFIIEDYKLCKYTKYFSTEKYAFHKDGLGFYTYLNDHKLYLKDIDNGGISCYMKKSLDENGHIMYKLGAISDTSDIAIPLELVFEYEGHNIKEKVSLFEYVPAYEKQDKSYIYTEISNIPVLKLKSFSPRSTKDNSMEDFLNDSKKLRSKDEFIIDLRGNTGGSMVNVEEWVKGFTGKRLQKDIVEAGLYTNTSLTLSKKKFKAKENQSEEVKNICLDKIDSYKNKNYFPGWSTVKYSSSKPIKNKTNIVILVDKKTASAAEFLVHYLKKLENVTIIGTLTKGCVLTGNPNMANLPNSNIKICLSHKIYMSKKLNNIDGFGLVPDLWVKPEESLNRAIKYLNNKK